MCVFLLAVAARHNLGACAAFVCMSLLQLRLQGGWVGCIISDELRMSWASWLRPDFAWGFFSRVGGFLFYIFMFRLCCAGSSAKFMFHMWDGFKLAMSDIFGSRWVEWSIQFRWMGLVDELGML